MKTRQNLTGNTYGELTVQEYAGQSNSNKTKWKCMCSCGNSCVVLSASLKEGRTRSCGCYHIKVTGDRFRKHGQCDLPEYNVWMSMRSRCNNPNNKEFRNYGGRGIKVCDRWSDFDAFLSDMGARPSPKHSIDRLNNSLGYSLHNCEWVLPKKQANNRRNTHSFTYGNQTKTLSEWAACTGIKHATLYYRLVLAGWSEDKALKL
jgi:hypothetical protein